MNIDSGHGDGDVQGGWRIYWEVDKEVTKYDEAYPRPETSLFGLVRMVKCWDRFFKLYFCSVLFCKALKLEWANFEEWVLIHPCKWFFIMFALKNMYIGHFVLQYVGTLWDSMSKREKLFAEKIRFELQNVWKPICSSLKLAQAYIWSPPWNLLISSSTGVLCASSCYETDDIRRNKLGKLFKF